MTLTESRVSRGLVPLEPDESGVLVTVRLDATIALARCELCGTRCRVLPCDALPGKTYGLAVIEHEVSEYGRGGRSLRQVAWHQLRATRGLPRGSAGRRGSCRVDVLRHDQFAETPWDRARGARSNRRASTSCPTSGAAS
jgi:hypothetical protein